MSRDPGRLGETFFQKLCAEAGLILNKSHDNDSAGWDYILEFPNNLKSSVELSSYEKDFSKPVCKIQIKSSDDSPMGHSIKLSNAARFVNDTVPAFFIFFELDGKSEPKSAYLVHVGKEVISQTIKRLRSADVKGEGKLHKKWIKISYSNENKLKEISGLSIFSSIKAYVGDNLIEYAKAKARIIETVGFEAGSHLVSFTTNDKQALEDLVNSALGLSVNASVHNVLVKEVRFGIEKKIHNVEEGTINIKPSAQPDYIDLICIDKFDNEHSRIKAQVYTPGSLYPLLPEELKKIRFKSTYSEMILSKNLKSTSLKLDIPGGTEEIDIFELRDQMDFFFDCIRTKRFRIEKNGVVLHDADFEINNISNYNLKELHNLVSFSCKILDHNKIKKCTTLLSLIERQKLSIYLNAIALNLLPDATVSTKVLENGVTWNNDKKISIVFSFGLQLGQWHFANAIAFHGDTKRKKTNGDEEINIESPKPLKHITLKKQSKFTKKQLEDLINKITSAKDISDYDFILPSNYL